MNYEEALALNEGDKIIIMDTKERHTVESISGTLVNIFVLLDNGREYRHNQIEKELS